MKTWLFYSVEKPSIDFSSGIPTVCLQFNFAILIQFILQEH